MSAHAVTLLHIENLRGVDAVRAEAMAADALRLHIERLAPPCVADLYALAELALPAQFATDLATWSARATREMRDMPDTEAKVFLAAVAELPPGKVPARMRDAVRAMAEARGGEIAGFFADVAARWEGDAPEVVTLPTAKARKAEAVTAGGDPVRKVAGAPKARAVRTPAAQVDPRRAAAIREDALSRLPQYERGLKESIVLASIRHRSPFKDLTDAEVLSELRRMERERKVKKTGDRWMMR